MKRGFLGLVLAGIASIGCTELRAGQGAPENTQTARGLAGASKATARVMPVLKATGHILWNIATIYGLYRLNASNLKNDGLDKTMVLVALISAEVVLEAGENIHSHAKNLLFHVSS